MFLSAPNIPDEDYRGEVLHWLRMLDSPPDPELDTLVELAAERFQVPICLVSLVDRDRQWFKARHGFDVPETARAPSFCGHAIANATPLVVMDTFDDLRFAENPFVTGPPNIRFYAGVPLEIMGARIGTLCLIDQKPARSFAARDITSLEKYGRLTEEFIDGRCQRLGIPRFPADDSYEQAAAS